MTFEIEKGMNIELIDYQRIYGAGYPAGSVFKVEAFFFNGDFICLDLDVGKVSLLKPEFFKKFRRHQPKVGTAAIYGKTGHTPMPITVSHGHEDMFYVLAKAMRKAQDEPASAADQDYGIGFQHGQTLAGMIEAQRLYQRGEFPEAENKIIAAIIHLANVAVEINRRAAKVASDRKHPSADEILSQFDKLAKLVYSTPGAHAEKTRFMLRFTDAKEMAVKVLKP